MHTAPRFLRIPLTAITLTLALVGSLLVYADAALASSRAAEPQPTVVATTGMVGDMVREIGGDRIRLTVLIGEGVDPHLYKPTRTDIAALARADAIFTNGLQLEGKLADTLKRIASSGKPVLAVAESVPRERLLTPDGADDHPDPHVWMDPALWAEAIPAVRDTLTTLDPGGHLLYEQRAAAYASRLAALDAYASRAIATIPEASRVLLTAHDAFGYFGRAYGLEVRGVQGISTESEAGVRDIERLVDLIASRSIRAIFVESTVSERNINAIIAGARARGHTVRVGGSLFSDAMGKPGTWEGTYIGMIDHNVRTITEALGGTVPEGGLRGSGEPSPRSDDPH